MICCSISWAIPEEKFGAGSSAARSSLGPPFHYGLPEKIGACYYPYRKKEN